MGEFLVPTVNRRGELTPTEWSHSHLEGGDMFGSHSEFAR